MGHRVEMIGPDRFRTVPLPGYPEIPLAVLPGLRTARLIDRSAPDCIHIATEGPLGWAARRYCLRRKRPFTTSLHTRFPEYLAMRAPVPLSLGYRILRQFHAPAVRTMVRTRSQVRELTERDFGHLEIWPGAVDIRLFRPRRGRVLDLAGPIALYAGRIAPEKSLEDFLLADWSGSKVLIGDGPARERLECDFPDAHFLGYRQGDELAAMMASADVFVFPSRTDTLGLVMLEAMACGVPVAAFPVTGPKDVVLSGTTGCLDEDLGRAMAGALRIDPVDCRTFATAFSWRESTLKFLRMLAPVDCIDSPRPKSPAVAPASGSDFSSRNLGTG
jgi:glycosyltransferase involved in cell wall biosynthesis